ncbi:hypothetical protein [Bacillus wiedmannii]|uniref:hypothetical protein n=1 Tax=Bacillus wiedmannii TaxID=1890302 RepID=UPI0021D30722|nr:hypothetical protein [Bacillus wiedmannii]MCU5596796.1 hypothetical protein [Bacillus wiedmannii]
MITKKLTDLTAAVGKIYRVMKEHIGSGEDAHVEATSYKNGFLSKEDKAKLNKFSLKDGSPSIIIKNTEDFYEKVKSLSIGYYTFASLAAKNAPELNVRGDIHVTANDAEGKPTAIRVSGVDLDGYLHTNYYSSSKGWIGWRKYENVFDSGWIKGTLVNGFSGSIEYRVVRRGNKKVFHIKFNIALSEGLTTRTKFTTMPSEYSPSGLTVTFNQIIHAVGGKGHTSCGLNIAYNGECYVYPIGQEVNQMDGYVIIDM